MGSYEVWERMFVFLRTLPSMNELSEDNLSKLSKRFEIELESLKSLIALYVNLLDDE